MVWYGMVWFGMIWFGYNLVWFGMVWYGYGLVMVWYGLVWFGMVWYGMVMVWLWFGMVLMVLYGGDYWTLTLIFHKTLNLFQFDYFCNQPVLSKFLAQGNNGDL